MKKCFNILFFILFVTTALAQPIIKIEKGMVTLDGKNWLMVQETIIDSKNTYDVLFDLSGELFAQLSFTNNSDRVFLKAEFPVLAKKYEINHPAGTILQHILESYNKNKVIVDGNIDLSGLQKYCDDRNTPLNKILTPEERKIAEANQVVVFSYSSESNKKSESPASAGSGQTSVKNVSFTLKNNSAKSVRCFIGKEAKYGSGRYFTASSNSISSEHATVGDKICIVDEHDNAISCTTISDGMNRIEINNFGTGFGK